MSVMLDRCSTRRFTNKVVEQEKIERILAAGMQAPSAHNGQPWEFIVVKEKTALKEISTFSQYSNMIQYAGAAIVVLGKKNENEEIARFIQQDLAACTENILLQIVEEGMGGVWIGTYPNKETTARHKEFFSLPGDIFAFSLIGFGYSDKEKKSESRFDVSKIYYEKYGV